MRLIYEAAANQHILSGEGSLKSFDWTPCGNLFWTQTYKTPMGIYKEYVCSTDEHPCITKYTQN